jgi:hypothetical protein
MTTSAEPSGTPSRSNAPSVVLTPAAETFLLNSLRMPSLGSTATSVSTLLLNSEEASKARVKIPVPEPTLQRILSCDKEQREACGRRALDDIVRSRGLERSLKRRLKIFEDMGYGRLSTTAHTSAERSYADKTDARYVTVKLI